MTIEEDDPAIGVDIVVFVVLVYPSPNSEGQFMGVYGTAVAAEAAITEAIAAHTASPLRREDFTVQSERIQALTTVVWMDWITHVSHAYDVAMAAYVTETKLVKSGSPFLRLVAPHDPV
jgi:hypothetical protein